MTLAEKPIRISPHAGRRMARYGISEDSVIHALREPDYVVDGYSAVRMLTP